MEPRFTTESSHGGESWSNEAVTPRTTSRNQLAQWYSSNDVPWCPPALSLSSGMLLGQTVSDLITGPRDKDIAAPAVTAEHSQIQTKQAKNTHNQKLKFNCPFPADNPSCQVTHQYFAHLCQHLKRSHHFKVGRKERGQSKWIALYDVDNDRDPEYGPIHCLGCRAFFSHPGGWHNHNKRCARSQAGFEANCRALYLTFKDIVAAEPGEVQRHPLAVDKAPTPLLLQNGQEIVPSGPEHRDPSCSEREKGPSFHNATSTPGRDAGFVPSRYSASYDGDKINEFNTANHEKQTGLQRMPSGISNSRKRRLLKIKPIKDDRNRSITFLKRKGGLFKKAHELSKLCSVDVAVFIFGTNKKLYEYSSGEMRELITRYTYHAGPNDHKGSSDFEGNTYCSEDDGPESDTDVHDLLVPSGNHSPQEQGANVPPLQSYHASSMLSQV